MAKLIFEHICYVVSRKTGNPPSYFLTHAPAHLGVVAVLLPNRLFMYKSPLSAWQEAIGFKA